MCRARIEVVNFFVVAQLFFDKTGSDPIRMQGPSIFRRFQSIRAAQPVELPRRICALRRSRACHSMFPASHSSTRSCHIDLHDGAAQECGSADESRRQAADEMGQHV